MEKNFFKQKKRRWNLSAITTETREIHFDSSRSTHGSRFGWWWFSDRVNYIAFQCF